MIHFCPNCWHEISPTERVCLHCSQSLATLDARSFDAKLIAALHHPEPGTPIRAAEILARRKVISAAPHLLGRVKEELAKAKSDPFIAAAMITAIGELGGVEPSCLKSFRSTKYPLAVRQAALQAEANLRDRRKRQEELRETRQLWDYPES